MFDSVRAARDNIKKGIDRAHEAAAQAIAQTATESGFGFGDLANAAGAALNAIDPISDMLNETEKGEQAVS